MPVVHPLTDLPAGAVLRSVTAVPAQVDGRAGLRVQLTDEVAHEGLPGVDYVDQPTFVIIPAEFAYRHDRGRSPSRTHRRRAGLRARVRRPRLSPGRRW